MAGVDVVSMLLYMCVVIRVSLLVPVHSAAVTFM